MIGRMPASEGRYSRQFLLICSPFDYFFHDYEIKIYAAYRKKWAQRHQDPNCTRLHTLFVKKYDKLQHEKFSCLKLADQYSRITIIGHFHLDTDYFSYDEEGKYRVLATNIIDIIRENVTAKSVLLRHLGDVQRADRALRITFMACNVGATGEMPSMAERMFQYACHHPQKALRLEMTAPLFYCGPFLGEKSKKNVSFNYLADLLTDDDILHKRYGAGIRHAGKWQFFTKGPSLLSMIFPEYKPENRKIILTIDHKNSTLGQIKIKKITPEEEMRLRKTP